MSAAKKYNVSSWVWRSNKDFVLNELARLVSYKISDLDIDAIEFGMEGTDSEIPAYFEYSFCGSEKLDFAISNESGADTLMVLVSASDHQASTVSLILDLAATYDIRARS
ncbi:hypothetical protein [Microbulbifer aggregans]|uniref:hypothetical protein n=1 Tax=Microbulbifer aggregans TaxID=1769779 RepID=UPI0011AB4739|nr:hypothetical protein [Microbulbifer aggregans]